MRITLYGLESREKQPISAATGVPAGARHDGAANALDGRGPAHV